MKSAAFMREDPNRVLLHECRCGLRFTLKSTERLRIPGYLVRKKLKRDETMQPDVLGLVNHAHPATAELFNDAIMRDAFADHRADAMVGRVVGASQRIQSLEELNQNS